MYYITSITIVIHKIEILNMYNCIYTHCICYLYICNYTYIYTNIYIDVRVSLDNVYVECRTYMYMQQMHTSVCKYCYVYKCKYTLIDVSVKYIYIYIVKYVVINICIYIIILYIYIFK